jgi:hypothetical protein
MSDDKKAKSATTTVLELGLLAGVGGWFCVSSLMAILGHAPQGALAQATATVIAALGVWPTFLASLSLAGIGAWSFLATRDVGAFRHALGVLFVGAGLSIALGPFSSSLGSLGGTVGDVVPSFVAGRLGVALAVGLGLAVILAAAWLLWVPAEDGFSAKPGEQRPVRAAAHPEACGVSPAEAEALVADVPRAAAVPSAVRTPSSADDIRNQGGVPSGARPLQKLHERHAPEVHHQADPGRGQAASAGRPADELARPDLAATGTPPAGPSHGGGPKPTQAAEPAALSEGVRPLADFAPDVADRPIWESAGADPAAGAFAAEDAAADEAGWADAADLPPAAWEEIADAYEPPVDDVLDLEQDSGPVADVLEDDAEEVDEELAEPEEALAEDDEDRAADEPLAAQAPSDPEVVLQPRAKPSAHVQQSSLFPDAAAEDEPAPVEIPRAAPAVAPPARAPKAPKTPKAAHTANAGAAPAPPSVARSDGPEDLIHAAASLILDENRVAVSMLQRRFELDFEAATAVLDVLQERGLIGPYLGGKTRDILMTREEWTAHAHGV